MDRARRPIVDFFAQNLHATHTNLAKPSGGPYVAAELRGDCPAVEHLATDTERRPLIAEWRDAWLM
eukprot:6918687-Prymnesium_polylepis.1